MLLVAAPAAHAATTVALEGPSLETTFGETTTLRGMVPTTARRRRPRGRLSARIQTTFGLRGVASTRRPAADGKYAFVRRLDRNWQFRVAASARGRRRLYVEAGARVRVPVHDADVPRPELARDQAHPALPVPKGVKLKQPTIF